MELLSGPTLADLIKERAPVPLDLALDLAEQTAAALTATHRVGVIHRDIKPSNLMFDDRGRLKVVDFGIARLTESTSAQLTATSTVVGSAAYMAPEQASGEPATPATDLYALGCVLMALLTGQPPFAAEHPLAVLQQHMNTPPPRIRARRPEIPADVDGLVHQILAKAPGHRPGGAEQVRAQLTAIRSTVSAPTADMPVAQVLTQALNPSTTKGTTRLPPLTVTRTRTATPPSRPTWLRWPLLATGAAFVLALMLIPMVIGEPDGSEQTDTQAPSPGRDFRRQTRHRHRPAPSAVSVHHRLSRPSAAPSLAEALVGLRDAIEAAAAADNAEKPAHEDLLRRVEDIEKRLADGHTTDLDRKLDDFDRRLDDLVREGKLTSEGAAAIRQALEQVQARLP